MILNRKLIEKFIDLAAHELEGDWLMLGGTVLPLAGAQHRTTADIDFVGLGKKERAQQLEVMRLTEKLGLPVETINSAATIFVDRALNDKNELVLLKAGPKCRIFRPNSELFFKLKIARLSESDLSDCLQWLSTFSNEINGKVLKRLAALVSHQKGASPDVQKRLDLLLQTLKELSG